MHLFYEIYEIYALGHVWHASALRVELWPPQPGPFLEPFLELKRWAWQKSKVIFCRKRGFEMFWARALFGLIFLGRAFNMKDINPEDGSGPGGVRNSNKETIRTKTKGRDSNEAPLLSCVYTYIYITCIMYVCFYYHCGCTHIKDIYSIDWEECSIPFKDRSVSLDL